MFLWLKNIVILIVVFFATVDYTTAQQDSVKADSTHLYKNIESYSKKSKFNRIIYRMVFNPVKTDSLKRAIKKEETRQSLNPYTSFEGKIIRNINIITFDPFGYSSETPTAGKQNFFRSAGNQLHIKTRTLAIRNLLVIRKNQSFNSLKVKESERLIRSQGFVHEVYFSVMPTGKNSDSVDIFIRELDKWSIIPGLAISKSAIKIELADKNILGSGQEMQSLFAKDFTTGINSFQANYTIPSIRNTFIRTTLLYMVDGYNNMERQISIDRPFFSPLARWAAGITLATQFRKDSLGDIINGYVPVSLKFNIQDYWAGIAYPVLKERMSWESVVNIVFALRYMHLHYSEKPPELTDPLNYYANEVLYLATAGISSRKYIQDKNLFKFGTVEDVPSGLAISVTSGFQVRNNIGRPYIGMHFSFGNYHHWGYLSPNIEYGTFFHKNHSEQGVITAGIVYFTGLISIGKWKLRQFVKPQFIAGINRFSYDSLTLNDGYGLDGFRSNALSGTMRMLLTLQTQSYSPWNLLGFHIGPFLVCSMGMLGNASKGFSGSKIYTQLGVGVLIKNENLVFRTFQFSISFYPVIPGRGNNLFIVNAYKTNDFGLKDFDIGKPEIVFNH